MTKCILLVSTQNKYLSLHDIRVLRITPVVHVHKCTVQVFKIGKSCDSPSCTQHESLNKSCSAQCQYNMTGDDVMWSTMWYSGVVVPKNRQQQIISHSQEYDCIKTDGELNQQTSSTVCRFSGQLDLLNHGCVWQLTLTNRKCTNHWIQQFRHQCHIIPKQIITNNTCSPVWGLQVISRSAT